MTGSDRTFVAFSLPVADRLAPRVELPSTRGAVVVAERLADQRTEIGVGVERVDRALERPRQRRQVGALGGVAGDRRWGSGRAAEAVGGRRSQRSECEVRVGVRAGTAALDPPALGVLAADRADRA